MTAADARNEEAFSAEERDFLSKLLDRLAEEHRAAHDALVEANPGLVELYFQFFIESKIRHSPWFPRGTLKTNS